MSAGALRLVVCSALMCATLAGLTTLAAAQQSDPQPDSETVSPDGDAADDGAEAAELELGAAADDAAPAAAAGVRAASAPAPAGMHLSSYASRVCARVDREGALDSGAGVLQLIDPDSGRPIPIRDLAFGEGPMLWAAGELDLPGVEAQVRYLAAPADDHGDTRVRALMRVELLNHGQDLVLVKLGARLSAGGGDPLQRPVDALDFAPGTRFTREDDVIARNGGAILAWEGPDPEVKLSDSVDAPDAVACTLAWELPVQPNTARYLDLSLAGPGHQPTLDEAGWRATLTNWAFSDAEEQLSWQTNSRGEYIAFKCADARLEAALDGAIHFLRTLGEANREVNWLTDRPYGFPPTDAAAPAQIMGVFFEWGMNNFSDAYLHELVATAKAAGQQLSPERRVALVAGLVSAVRLSPDDEALVKDMAEVVRTLVTQEAPVEPWLDPALVRADMAALLVRADAENGPAAAAALPTLHWDEGHSGPIAAHMLAARRALSERDRAGFWEHFSALVDGTNRNGLGSMQPGGDLDGRFPVGLMCLARAMFLDDHGPNLYLLPGAHVDMLPQRDELDMPWLPTVFGRADIETYRMPNRRLATTVRLRAWAEPELVYVFEPYPLVPIKLVACFGGQARIMPDGSVTVAIDPSIPVGLNFSVTAREEQPAER